MRNVSIDPPKVTSFIPLIFSFGRKKIMIANTSGRKIIVVRMNPDAIESIPVKLFK
jgi:hypothetical protein